MVRPRNLTRMFPTGATAGTPKSRNPDRIKVDTRETISMTIPARYAAYQEKIALIVHTVSKSPEKDPRRRLADYLNALENIPDLVAAHAEELKAARKVLHEVMEQEWKTSGETIIRDELLKIMFFNLS